ncbi:hypothetical protein HALLA_20305 (plasmid) [Halostagnicola larsenii XH-48]|uniref:Uncharacterized protein n=1 Tax=Halostagnicola larsenii XH-48 TaxID=797299 RepID=W0JUI9_9EURY|nr:hypothetical protein HALLA_20305 [Halostagnicola larsenii XH-48]
MEGDLVMGAVFLQRGTVVEAVLEGVLAGSAHSLGLPGKEAKVLVLADPVVVHQQSALEIAVTMAAKQRTLS